MLKLRKLLKQGLYIRFIFVKTQRKSWKLIEECDLLPPLSKITCIYWFILIKCSYFQTTISVTILLKVYSGKYVNVNMSINFELLQMGNITSLDTVN